MADLSEGDRKELARDLAAEIFLHLGVDVNDPAQMKSLRDNLGFLERMARGAREAKSAIVKTCVGALITGIVSLVVIGLKDWFDRAH